MKHFRDIYLIGISFIAGVLFIIQCGGATKTIAQAIGSAIGIEYSNNSSGLEAKDVQAAIDELSSSVKSVTSLVEATTPFVYDSLGGKIGVYISRDKDSEYMWEILDLSKKVLLSVEPTTGKIIEGEIEQLFFTATDCSGAPFMRLNNSTIGGFAMATKNSAFINNKFYVYKENGLKIGADDVQSFIINDGSCITSSLYYNLKKSISGIDARNLPAVFLEATEIEKPADYSGPIFIK